MTDIETADRKALEKLAKRPDSGDHWEAVETDEPTPADPDAYHRAVMRKLDAVLAAQAVTARVLLRHDDWLVRAGRVWDVAARVANSKVTWLVTGILTVRPELIPDWLREAFWAAVKAGGGGS
jgi:hypothetical protein